MKNYYKRTWGDNSWVIVTDIKLLNDGTGLCWCFIVHSKNQYYTKGSYDHVAYGELVQLTYEEVMLEIL